MSLKAALKAGLVASDAKDGSPSGETRKNLVSHKKPDKEVPKLRSMSLKSTDKPAMSLAVDLSDSLPKPKLSVKSAFKAANINEVHRKELPSKEIQESPLLVPSSKAAEDGGAKGRVNPRQYVRELDRFLNKQNGDLTKGVVLDVSSVEIEQVVKLSARVRGRYIAKLLDVGTVGRGSLKESELSELRRSRQSFEELSAGIDLLKNAIANGDILITG
ncbi:MAG: hypothetical protein CMM58_10720 [Rhodospirillaceae bacterium]|nr:hypothetical protein [Rhodospirillaceae bacterium]|tara:strand:+ start:1303 stop:1953 length:651 start_codon:yes stop_codon:yes gene_type:complete